MAAFFKLCNNNFPSNSVVCMLIILCCLDIVSISASCPCKRSEWCQPINQTFEKEVFVFSVRNDPRHWEKFDWTKLTTVVMFGYLNQDLVCLAHSHGVRAATLGSINTTTLVNPQFRTAWIKRLVNLIEVNFLDGVNFDYENAILKEQVFLRDSYTQTVNETFRTLKRLNKNYQITVDVAWKPNVDSRFYDYAKLGQVSDFLFVMAYDEQSQIFGQCIAGPNSDLTRAELGLRSYIKDPVYNLSSKKLVLGVPWYGYIYKCLRLTGEICHIEEVPFRNVSCSDAAGRQYDYSSLLNTLKTLPKASKWNATSSTPYFSYTDASTGLSYQAQYDDPASLSLKYRLARLANLRGVGCWNVDSLDYSDSQAAEAMRAKMFGAFSVFLD